MIEYKWNSEWKFWVDKDAFALVWNIPETAREITLPHDAMIEKPAYAESLNKGNTGFRDGEVYNYVRLMKAPKEYQNKTVKLKFEGVYMNALVYVNGQLAGKNPFGYTTFYVELSDYLRYGEQNEIRVQVRNGAMTNSRWYSGGGIYRDVYLLVSDLVHIEPEGVQIKTETADADYAVLQISTELKNRCHIPVNLRIKTTIKDSRGNTAAADEQPVTLFEGEARKLLQRVAVKQPCLWSEQSPDLYQCVTAVYQDDELMEESTVSFGIRKLELDASRGLRVNGESVKLRGACIHHDSGLLGAATYEEAQIRQIRKLKEAGFNAVRMSHHPMAPAMLRACDTLGVYVMDESFDMWNRCKSDYDYGLYFQEWWEKDVTAMVRKDFNHPSVIMYSVGNEIPEIATDHGAKICHDICMKIKELDDTRYTLASINGVFAAGDAVDQIVKDVVSDLSQTGEIDGNVNDFMTLMDGHLDEIVVHPAISERLEKACAATDIAGYNYMTARYEPDSAAYPNRVIVGSETYPPEIARNWGIIKRYPNLIGDFTWTGWDYIGEAGVGVPAYQWGEGGFGAGFPCQLAYVGDFDITGIRRPASYFREIVFGLRKEPYIAVQNPHKYGEHLIKTPWIISDAIASWTWSGMEGNPVVAEVYAPGDEVELFCNNKSLGRKPAGEAAGCRVLFETIYEPGTLTAVGYEKGAEISRTELTTAGAERSWHIRPETQEGSLVYIPIAYTDKQGILVADQDCKIQVSVDGGADFAGFGSGNPKPNYNYTDTTTETWQGRALLILRKNGSSDNVKVTIETDKEEQITAEIALI